MVCFTCRKTFKAVMAFDIMKREGVWAKYDYLQKRTRKDHPRPLTAAEKELLESLENKYGDNRAFKCPECGDKMADVGLDYRAPRKNDLKEWTTLRKLYKSGFNFMSCGCSGPGFIPKNEREYLDYLNDRLKTYEKNIIRDDEFTYFWNQKIRRIKAELKKLPR